MERLVVAVRVTKRAVPGASPPAGHTCGERHNPHVSARYDPPPTHADGCTEFLIAP
jgi:hypothetical protein